MCVCLIVLAAHTLLSPQSCHAYPAPLSQRNITVSYDKGGEKEEEVEGGGSTFSKSSGKCNFPASLRRKKFNSKQMNKDKNKNN